MPRSATNCFFQPKPIPNELTRMKAPLLLAAASITIAHAGPAPSPSAPTEVAAGPAWLIPMFDARVRYEFSNIENFDDSHALTLRVRPGLKTRPWHGFSALAEGEFTGAAIDDYHGGAPGARPFDPANSLIADPQNAELNRALVQYQGFDTTVIIGRQRIIYDNSAFIGNVGWRQNEQTYDAASVAYDSENGFHGSYAWINRVNRIFGHQADGAFSDVGANIHLIRGSYSGWENVTVGGYAYLMEFHDTAVTGWDNNTFGISADAPLGIFDTHAEFAFQDKAGPDNDRQALYFHVHATTPLPFGKLTVGVEQLDQGFQTPLATLHAMNGFADTTDPLRAAGTTGGLTDTYISHTAPLPWDLKWTNVAHFFGDNNVDTSFGFGFDSLLVKKFDDHFTATAMLGYFDTNDARYASATKASVQLDYTF